jgi:hypothetical protein
VASAIGAICATRFQPKRSAGLEEVMPYALTNSLSVAIGVRIHKGGSDEQP